jgi:type IV secretion system protein VirB11
MTHEALPLLRDAMSVFDLWLKDPAVEDILVNRPGEVFVRRGSTTTVYDLPSDFIDLEGIAILAGSIKRQNVGRERPLLSCDLPGGIRLQACHPPCVNDRTVALAIRRPRGNAPSLDDLSEMFTDVRTRTHLLSDIDSMLVGLYRRAQQADDKDQGYKEFLKAAVKARKTIVLCGTVGTGKTTFAMGLIREIPLTDRLSILQDADEWTAIPHQNKVELFFSKGMQGESQVTANDLVEASLRLAMDWLLLQELRGGEVFSFLRARRSGHPSITTMHSDSAAGVFPALALMAKQNPAIAGMDTEVIEAAFRSVIDCIVHLHRPHGKFRISEIWFREA